MSVKKRRQERQRRAERIEAAKPTLSTKHVTLKSEKQITKILKDECFATPEQIAATIAGKKGTATFTTESYFKFDMDNNHNPQVWLLPKECIDEPLDKAINKAEKKAAAKKKK